jgi:prolipoprotein diacylglyceryltransferase
VTTIGYGVIRFVLSFVRQETVIVFGLQEAQIVAVVTSLVAAGILLFRLIRAGTAAPALR